MTRTVRAPTRLPLHTAPDGYDTVNEQQFRQAVDDRIGLLETTVVVGLSSATDNAAVRFDGTTGALVQDSALLVADTTGALSRSGNGGIPVQGTNTNDSASAGYVGEVISSNIAAGSAVSVTTTTATNITSISLTAGDWDISGQVALTFSDTPSQIVGNINTTSATLGTAGLGSPDHSMAAGFTTGFTQVIGLPTGRLSLNSTTTVYLIGYAVFGAGTSTGYGWIMARRAR